MKSLMRLMFATTALATCAAATGAAFADDLPILASPGTWGGWKTDHAMFDFGAQIFIDKPGSTAKNSAAKLNQYGTQTDPFGLNAFNLGLSSANEAIRAELLGKNIGTNHQDLELDVAVPGTNYLTFGWYKVPNLRSNTAQTIFNGIGTTNLTVPSNVVQALHDGVFNSAAPITAGSYANSVGANSTIPVQNQLNGANGLPVGTLAFVPKGCLLSAQGAAVTSSGVACAPGVTPVQTTINNNLHQIDLGIQHDRKEINERWTPDEHWDIKVQLSSDHRWGLQEQGFLFSTGTSTAMAQVAMPVDDVTQDASISAEYSGLSPWGMNWNAMLKYNLSVYTDKFAAFTAENPFGGPGSPVGASVAGCPVATATTNFNCYGMGQMSTAPTNGANAIMGQVGVDLPWFKNSRYMLTFNYNDMRQNQAFLPMTINPGSLLNGSAAGATLGSYPATSGTSLGVLSPLSRSSLSGNIDTLLVNNVLSSNITSDLKNKLTYRYYSNQNHTPPMTFANWVLNDAAISTGAASYANHSTLFSSYIKQNISDELTWSPIHGATVGVFGGLERHDYTQYAVNHTNEGTAKVFANLNPWDWLTIRASDAYSVRRYGEYDWQKYIGAQMGGGLSPQGLAEGAALVAFNVANRNRNVGSLYFDIQTPVEGLTLTPTASMRWDNYPVDQNILNRTGSPYQQGVTSDHSWTAGTEANWTINPNLQVMGAYMYSSGREKLLADQSTNLAQVYYSNMSDYVHTFMVGATWQAIPDKLTVKLSATHELGTDKWATGPMPGCVEQIAATASAANCGVVSPGNPAYPPMGNKFDHVDLKFTYKIDDSLIRQAGFSEGFLSLKLNYEQNSVTNWQSSAQTAYMFSTLNSSTTAMKSMIFMAGNNPNYRAEAVMTNLVLKW